MHTSNDKYFYTARIKQGGDKCFFKFIEKQPQAK
jgi:hypothetical protein